VQGCKKRSFSVPDTFVFPFERHSRIISFNYDTMLDESLFKHCTSSWSYDDIPVLGINGYPVAPPGVEADLLYIKPHGSLNMLYCRSCNAMHIHWFVRYVPRGAGEAAKDNRRCSRCKTAKLGRAELMAGLVSPRLYDKTIIQESEAVGPLGSDLVIQGPLGSDPAKPPMTPPRRLNPQLVSISLGFHTRTS